MIVAFAAQTIYANRGKDFENLIELANQQYLSRKIAVIQKVSTPWNVVRSEKKIMSAFPEEESTVDYIGIMMDGRGIAFDAKSCKIKTSFPFSNIKEHQVQFLQNWQEMNGTAFFLIEMISLRRTFRIPLENFLHYWNEARRGGRKSIAINELQLFREVRSRNGLYLDYLEGIS